MVVGWVITLALAALLAAAAAAKLVTAAASSVAVAELLGVGLPAAGRVVRVVAAVELAVAATLALRTPGAHVAAAVLLGAFAAVQLTVLARRGSGVPCGCYGPRSRIDARSAATTVLAALAATAVAIAAPDPAGSALAGWSVAGVALVALVVVLGVARDLAARVADPHAPAGALEIADEGPPLGSHVSLPGPVAPLRLAVFTSPGCALCRQLEPAIAAYSAHAEVAVVVFDEQRDAPVWRVAGIPGSPYAVVLDAAGRVWAKGAFNTVRQLDSVLATAARRRDTGAHAA